MAAEEDELLDAEERAEEAERLEAQALAAEAKAAGDQLRKKMKDVNRQDQAKLQVTSMNDTLLLSIGLVPRSWHSPEYTVARCVGGN